MRALPYLALRSIAVLLAMHLGLDSAQATVQRSLIDLKAAYIYNFILVTEWPDEKYRDEDAVRVAVITDKSQRNRWKEAFQEVDGTLIDNRRLHIEVMDSAAEPGLLEKYHLVYATESAQVSPTELLHALSDHHVLTVGDDRGFAADGGMIEFVFTGEYLRFIINRGSINRSSLIVASQLYNLALQTIGR